MFFRATCRLMARRPAARRIAALKFWAERLSASLHLAPFSSAACSAAQHFRAERPRADVFRLCSFWLSALRPDVLRLSSLWLIALRLDGLQLCSFGLPVGSRPDALRPDGLRHCNFRLSALRPHGMWLRCLRLRALRLSTCGLSAQEPMSLGSALSSSCRFTAQCSASAG